MEKLRDELEQAKLDFGIVRKEYCSTEEENKISKLKEQKLPLPEGIVEEYENEHFRYIETDLTDEELSKLITYRQTRYLKSIKNSLIFFVTLAVISLIAGIILVLNTLQIN